MADMAFSDLTDLLHENYGKLFVDLVVREGEGNSFAPERSLLGRLRRAGKVFIGGADGNNRYVREWGLKVAGKSAASFGAGDAYPVATQPTYDDASIGWKRVGEMVATDNLIRLATGGAATRNAIPAMTSQIKDALQSIMDAIADQLASDGTGNGGKDIDGFKAFLSTGNTYATIAQGGQPLWQANIVAGGAATLTKTMLRTLVRNADNRGAIGPNCELWMSTLQLQRYMTLYSGDIRFAPGGVGGSVAPRFVDSGFDIPIYNMRSVPTDEVWMVNTDHLEFRFLDHRPEDELPLQDEEMMYEGSPIGFEKVETGTDSKAMMLKVYGNLCCTSPYHQSAITGLATTAP